MVLPIDGALGNKAEMRLGELAYKLPAIYFFVSGSADSTIKKLEKRVLITGYTDNTIKYWDIEIGELIHTLSPRRSRKKLKNYAAWNIIII